MSTVRGRGGARVAFAVPVVILVITTKIIIVVVVAVVPGTAAAVVIVVSANIVIRVACYAKTQARAAATATARRVVSCRVASNKMWQHLAAFFDLTSFVFV